MFVGGGKIRILFQCHLDQETPKPLNCSIYLKPEVKCKNSLLGTLSQTAVGHAGQRCPCEPVRGSLTLVSAPSAAAPTTRAIPGLGASLCGGADCDPHQWWCRKSSCTAVTE